MKKLFLLSMFLCGAFFCKAQNYEQADTSSRFGKTEVYKYLTDTYSGATSDGSSWEAFSEETPDPQARKKVIAQIGWTELSTGCIGYTTAYVNTFLGIQIGGVHIVETYVYCP